MEVLRKIIFPLFMLLTFQTSFAQSERKFEKAVADLNFKKVERMVCKLVKRYQEGQTYFNGEGSGIQIDLSPSLDSINNWLKGQNCVEDAFWDKCQIKVAIYPGMSSVGVKFKTKEGIIEKCFKIQEGTTGQINIFGWHPKMSKAKKVLVYKRMYDCAGFVDLQKRNCGL